MFVNILKELTKRRFHPVIENAKSQGKRWRFRNGKLIVEGEVMQLPQDFEQPHPQIRPNTKDESLSQQTSHAQDQDQTH